MVQTKCEVYSRIVGYIRPVEAWHTGKQAEFTNRKEFIYKEPKSEMTTQTNIQTRVIQNG